MKNLIENDSFKQLIIDDLTKRELSVDDLKIRHEEFVEIKPLGVTMDLSSITYLSWGDVVDSLKQNDVMSVLSNLRTEEWMTFVFYNSYPLKKLGLYEEALLNAFTSIKLNFQYISLDTMKRIFYNADKERLFNAGDPLPEEKESYTLYRGLSGKGSNRRKRSISWTASFDVAKWFASRFPYELPMVYRAEVPRENIYAYYNQRNEEEFLCDITSDIDLVEVWRNDTGEFKPFDNPVYKKAS